MSVDPTNQIKFHNSSPMEVFKTTNFLENHHFSSKTPISMRITSFLTLFMRIQPPTSWSSWKTGSTSQPRISTSPGSTFYHFLSRKTVNLARCEVEQHNKYCLPLILLSCWYCQLHSFTLRPWSNIALFEEWVMLQEGLCDFGMLHQMVQLLRLAEPTWTVCLDSESKHCSWSLRHLEPQLIMFSRKGLFWPPTICSNLYLSEGSSPSGRRGLCCCPQPWRDSGPSWG